MRGNTFGKIFSLTSFGESHGPVMGVVIDGFPPGINIDLAKLQSWVDQRSAKSFTESTERKEADQVEILSGIFENKSLGTPIAIIVKNTQQKSQDYEKLKDQFRPGHADQTTLYKYGIRDYRGGGRSSGRETISRVIAGYFASLIIPKVKIASYITQIGPKYKSQAPAKIVMIENKFNFPNQNEKEISTYLQELKAQGESAGGKITCIIENCPKGLGEPAFDKLKAEFSKAFMTIGSCVAVQLGDIDLANKLGSEISKDSANFSGIEGGISNGEIIKFTLTFKAPSTVGNNAKEGRHDPCILPRALAVVNSMAYIVLADHFLRQSAFQLELPEYSK